MHAPFKSGVSELQQIECCYTKVSVLNLSYQVCCHDLCTCVQARKLRPLRTNTCNDVERYKLRRPGRPLYVGYTLAWREISEL